MFVPEPTTARKTTIFTQHAAAGGLRRLSKKEQRKESGLLASWLAYSGLRTLPSEPLAASFRHDELFQWVGGEWLDRWVSQAG